jgi:hypothetical protein
MKKVFLILTVFISLAFNSSSFAQDKWFIPGQHYVYNFSAGTGDGSKIHYDVVYDEAANATVTITTITDKGQAYGVGVLGNSNEISFDENANNLSYKTTDAMQYFSLPIDNGGQAMVASGGTITVGCDCNIGTTCSVSFYNGFCKCIQNSGCARCTMWHTKGGGKTIVVFTIKAASVTIQ